MDVSYRRIVLHLVFNQEALCRVPFVNWGFCLFSCHPTLRRPVARFPLSSSTRSPHRSPSSCSRTAPCFGARSSCTSTSLRCVWSPNPIRSCTAACRSTRSCCRMWRTSSRCGCVCARAHILWRAMIIFFIALLLLPIVYNFRILLHCIPSKHKFNRIPNFAFIVDHRSGRTISSRRPRSTRAWFASNQKIRRRPSIFSYALSVCFRCIH